MVAWSCFTGEQQEGTNGLTYLRARYYNPALGRFLTPDSLIPDVTNGQARNAYAYVYNDPINLVDPSGNIGIFPVMPTSIIKFSAQKGLDFLDWWDSKPDDCDCNQNPSYIVDVTKVINAGANYLAQAAWGKATTPAKMVAGTVGKYVQAVAPSQYRSVLGNTGLKLVGIQHSVDVTGWYKGGAGYTSELLDDFSGKGAALLGSNSGKKALYLRDIEPGTSPGMTGFIGSVVGAGLIDSFFQFLGDWASNLCLSPEQYAQRWLIALEFGLLAGAFGAFAAVVAVAAGASAGVAAGASIGTGYLVTRWLDNLKQDYLDVIEPRY